jgi:DNA-directed RNA polymerase specialized sigma subunit
LASFRAEKSPPTLIQKKESKMKKVKSAQETLTNLKRRSEKAKDIQLLHELLPSLCDEGILAIYFRYWECLLINDIAQILGKSWEYTDQLIENSIKALRDGFLNATNNNKQLRAA